MFDASQFAIRPFLWSGAVMAGCMLVLPADTAPGLAMLWSLFAILVALVNVYRHGLRQGLLIPILTMLLIGMLGGPGLFGIFCIEGLLMFLASAGLVRLRPASSAMPRPSHRSKSGEEELVSVTAQGQTQDMSAADVLASFGLGEGRNA